MKHFLETAKFLTTAWTFASDKQCQKKFMN